MPYLFAFFVFCFYQKLFLKIISVWFC